MEICMCIYGVQERDGKPSKAMTLTALPFFITFLEEKKLEDTMRSQFEINLHKFAVCTVRLRYNEITKAIKKENISINFGLKYINIIT